MYALCYAKPCSYTTLDKTPVNTFYPPSRAYNTRQNSREHSVPPNPFVKVDMYPDQLNIDNLGGGGREEESVHIVLSNVVFEVEIGSLYGPAKALFMLLEPFC